MGRERVFRVRGWRAVLSFPLHLMAFAWMRAIGFELVVQFEDVEE